MNLGWMLERSARNFPHKPALVSETESYTFRELLLASKRAASVFRDVGVVPEDRVGIMTFNTAAFGIAQFGIWRAGAVVVPINHKLSANEVRYIVEHSELKVIIVDHTLSALVREAAPAVTVLVTGAEGEGSFDAAVEQAGEWDGDVGDADSVAQILYTSGTTSEPKGCLHTHRALANVPAFTSSTIGLSREDRILIAMPIWHAGPLNNWFLTAIFMGCTTVLQREYHPGQVLEVIERFKVSVFFGAPIAFVAPLRSLAAEGKTVDCFDLSSMRFWLYGGGRDGGRNYANVAAVLQDRFLLPRLWNERGGPGGVDAVPARARDKTRLDRSWGNAWC